MLNCKYKETTSSTNKEKANEYFHLRLKQARPTDGSKITYKLKYNRAYIQKKGNKPNLFDKIKLQRKHEVKRSTSNELLFEEKTQRTNECSKFHNRLEMSKANASSAIICLEPQVQIQCRDDDGNDESSVSLLYSYNNNKNQIEIEDLADEELRCPKCRITYMNKMSLKNHIQVCKKEDNTCLINSKNQQQDTINNFPKIPNSSYVTTGRQRLSEDEKRSLKILEQSCFNNIDQIPYDIKGAEEVANRDSTSAQKDIVTYTCEECDEEYSNQQKFARHCYAHTFIKIGKSWIRMCLNFI